MRNIYVFVKEKDKSACDRERTRVVLRWQR